MDKTIVFFPGMWGRKRNFSVLADCLNRSDPQTRFLHVHYPGHEEEPHETTRPFTIDDYINSAFGQFVDYAGRNADRELILIGHSLGLVISANVLQRLSERPFVKRVNRIKGLIGIAGTPPPRIRLFNWRLLTWCAIRAMWTGEQFTLTGGSARFIRDRSKAALGAESGMVLRQVAFGQFKLPPLSELATKLGIKTELIIPVSDRVVPIHKASEAALYHGAMWRKVPGGHFCFMQGACLPICEAIKDWDNPS